MKADAAQCHACIYWQNPVLELRQDPFYEPCPEHDSLRRVAPLDAAHANIQFHHGNCRNEQCFDNMTIQPTNDNGIGRSAHDPGFGWLEVI
ncbi:hypothetical protein [Pseudogemmobacter faecipullorum]|uniref:Uncharacterized protein n=1 Tax=Pseudogemmobacter faecipullorum TaxID=2755041 RepID=A0ABS8CQI7_9RHOB|nr:hypothetical protein [Pseudogemmobacter faecipullorum]MCB5411623.1 hypothetical protein [Pseudogemmobacter faecipullorum]